MKTATNTTIPTNNRLDYLDAVRAFALLLGIVFHASLSFLPIYIGWAVMDINTSPVVGTFMLISHSFRMELFFLVAGFFSHMTYYSKGAATFVKSRIVRIAIPFVIGWFLLRPLLVSGWAMGMQSMRGEVSVLPSLIDGFKSLLGFLSAPFTGTHLWFLYYLLIITASVLLLRTLIGSSKPINNAVTAVGDAAMRWLSHSRLAIIVLALPTAACLWFMSHWGMDTPDKALAPQWPVYCVYAGFFVFGWLMHRQTALMQAFSGLGVSKLLIGIAAVVACVVLSGYEANSGHPQYTFFKLAFVFSYGVMMWSLVAITIGLFRRFLNKPSKVVRYVADSSYWLYLIHLPIVIWLQIAFAEVELHWGIKLALISGITIGLSLVLYDLFVRSTFIGAVLNGRRKERAMARIGMRNPAQPQALK